MQTIRKCYSIQISKDHESFGKLDDICLKTKNLYNSIQFICRQYYFESDCRKFIGLKELYDLASKLPEWKETGSTRVSNQVLRKVNTSWKSYGSAKFDYIKNKDKYTAKPKCPNYLKKDGRYLATFFDQSISKPKFRNGILKFATIDYEFKLPDNISLDDLTTVEIVPCYGFYKIIINYKQEIDDSNILNENLFLGIDYGVDNLATITSNKKGFKPIIINGKPIKSANQYFNKKTARINVELSKEKLKTSKRKERLFRKRNNKINHEFHCISKIITKIACSENISTIIIGSNKGWKTKSKLSKKVNQKFQSIPYSKLTDQIIYKFEEKNGKVIVNEESYTSKASFLDNDEIPIYKPNNDINHKFRGKRIKRGLYRSESGILINADVNGSYNIIKKVVPNAFANGIEDVVIHPVIIDSFKNHLLSQTVII